jgi:ATP-dependent Clp protease ATP-binding subunit ClpC
MFERFTERARQVVVLAQGEARTLGHNYLGTEHLLLGLLREEEGIAARVLAARGVTVEDVRVRVVGIVGLGDAEATEVLFTPRMKRVLEFSLRECLTLGQDWIDTEHLLLGLAREPEGLAARILADNGVSGRIIAEDVLRLLGSPSPTYVAQFSEHAAETASAPARLRIPRSALVAGWAIFGLALAIGLLAGWLIWG